MLISILNSPHSIRIIKAVKKPSQKLKVLHISLVYFMRIIIVLRPVPGVNSMCKCITIVVCFAFNSELAVVAFIYL